MPRRFTLPEAERFLPSVEKNLREAISLRTEYQEAERALSAVAQKVALMGGVVLDRAAVSETRARRDRSGQLLKKALETIQETGCLIKDLDAGLVDFPTLLRGQEVYLCWKLGESGIGYWHGVREGFAGRKRIDQDFLDHHQGDAPN